MFYMYIGAQQMPMTMTMTMMMIMYDDDDESLLIHIVTPCFDKKRPAVGT